MTKKTKNEETENKETEIAEEVETTEVAVTAGSGIALNTVHDGTDFFSVQDNMEGVVARLPIIKVLNSAYMFQMPDGSKVDSFEGHMIDARNCGAWWEKSFLDSGGGESPECQSLDGINVEMNSPNIQTPTGKCKDCQWSVFGSARNGRGGRDCKSTKRIHITAVDHPSAGALPMRYMVSTMSIGVVDDFVTSVSSKLKAYQSFRVLFSLKKDTQNGMDYAKLVIEPVYELKCNSKLPDFIQKDYELYCMIGQQYKEMLPIMRGQSIISNDE